MRLQRATAARAFAALVGGWIAALSFPPAGLILLQPIGLAAMLWAIRDLKPRTAFYAGFGFGMTFFGGSLWWMTRIFGPSALPLWAILALFPGLFAAVVSWMLGRHRRLPTTLLIPVVWTATELVRSELFWLDFGWSGLGYAWLDFPLPAASQAVGSALGSYGLTVLAAWMASLMSSDRWTEIRFAWICPALVLAAVAIGQVAHKSVQPLPGRSLTVKLVQAPSEDEEALFGHSRLAPGEAKPDILLWPEYSFLRDPRKDPRLWPKLLAVAATTRTAFVFGATQQIGLPEDDRYANTAFVLSPDGAVLHKHGKNHPIHFFKDGIRGTAARSFGTPKGNLGVGICFDFDYPDVARRLVQDGAEAFLVPNMDPPEWGPVQRAQHRLMFRMRALECGRWLARADVAGGTSIVDHLGRERASIRGSLPGSIRGEIRLIGGRTPCVRWGWMFPRVCLAALMVCCLVSLFTRKRSLRDEVPGLASLDEDRTGRTGWTGRTD